VGSMGALVARRLAGALVLALGVATLLFFLIRAAPGDPVTTLSAPGASPEAAERLRSTLALDRPLPEQYVRWIGAVAGGDLGVSYTYRRPVLDVFRELVPNTLLLSGIALVLSFALGVAVGTLQATRAGSVGDRLVSTLTLTLYSIPSFWLAVVLVLLFSYLPTAAWGWNAHLPASGMASVTLGEAGVLRVLWDRALHLVLPTLTLVLILGSGVARFARASMIEALSRDFIRGARARGLSERRVVWGHALPNALLPVLALLGLQIPLLLGGTVFVEAVFAWPGMGKLMVDAILQRDYPVIVGGGLLFAGVVVVANLLADLLMAAADPRVRLEAKR
jgi:peptide/nickel transport system permease protein